MERRKFTREFKLEAVRLIKGRGVSYVQASQSLGMHTSQLRDWVKKLAHNPQQALPGQGEMKPEQLEIAPLKREVIKLKAERDGQPDVLAFAISQLGQFRPALVPAAEPGTSAMPRKRRTINTSEKCGNGPQLDSSTAITSSKKERPPRGGLSIKQRALPPSVFCASREILSRRGLMRKVEGLQAEEWRQYCRSPWDPHSR